MDLQSTNLNFSLFVLHAPPYSLLYTPTNKKYTIAWTKQTPTSNNMKNQTNRRKINHLPTKTHISLNISWPALIFITKRIVKVKGRTNKEISSTQLSRGITHKGTPSGVKCAVFETKSSSKFWTIIVPTIQIDNIKIYTTWVEKWNIPGIIPPNLSSSILKNKVSNICQSPTDTPTWYWAKLKYTIFGKRIKMSKQPVNNIITEPQESKILNT